MSLPRLLLPLCVCCVSQVLCSSRWCPPHPLPTITTPRSLHHSHLLHGFSWPPCSSCFQPWHQIHQQPFLFQIFFFFSCSPSAVVPPRPLKQARRFGSQPPPPRAPVPPLLLLLLLRLSTEAFSPSVLVSPEGDSGLHPAGGSSFRRLSPQVEAPAGLGWAGLGGNRKGVSAASSPTLLDSHARKTHSRSAFSFWSSSRLPPSRLPLPPSVPTSLLSLSLSYSFAGSPPPTRATQTHTGSLWLGRANESKCGREGLAAHHWLPRWSRDSRQRAGPPTSPLPAVRLMLACKTSVAIDDSGLAMHQPGWRLQAIGWQDLPSPPPIVEGEHVGTCSPAFGRSGGVVPVKNVTA